MKEALKWAKDRGFRQIELSTGIREKGKPLYEEFGFKVTGFDEADQDWLMKLELV